MRLRVYNNQFVFFVTLIFMWLACVVLNHYFYASKFNHYDKTYQEFIERNVKLQNSSEKARNDLVKNLKHSADRDKGVLFNNSNRFLCVSILSKNRINSNLNYVNQAVMSLLTRVSLKQSELSFILFNTEENPTHNKHALELSKLIHVESLSSDVIYPTNVRVKEAADYALAIRKLNAKECNYQLILEDDIIAQFDWFNRIKTIVSSIPLEHKDRWLVIKLFTGYKFWDWDWTKEWKVWLHVVYVSAVVSFLSYIIFSKLMHQQINKIKFALILVNSVGLVVFCVTTSVAPIKWNAIREYSTGFGGVALLFNRNNSIKFAQYLEKVVGDYLIGKSTFFQAKDLLIEKFKCENNFSEFIAEPSLFQHQGIHSSLYNRDTTYIGFEKMYKSYSFLEGQKLIEFNSDIKK